MWFVAEDCVWLRRIGGQLVRIFDQVLRICHVLLKQASKTETAFLIIIVKLNEIIEKYNNNKNSHPYIKSGGSHKSDLDFDKTQFTQISQVISQ